MRAIWLTSTAYIHDNEFVNVSGINTTGTSISASNLPTIQQSEKVFSNVFDILKMDYSFSYPDVSQDLKGKVQVISYPNYSLAEVTG